MSIHPVTPPEGTPLPSQNNGITCSEIAIFAFFLLGAGLMFAKTSDLMSAFAPKTIFGYTGLEALYGVAVAVLVEGLIAVLKLKMLFIRAKTPIEWGYDILLTAFPFAISAFAQVFDSFIIRDSIQGQPAWIQFLANWGIPSIPTAITAGILVWGFINSAPEGFFAGGVGSAGMGGERRAGLGLGRFWPFGRKAVNPSSASTD